MTLRKISDKDMRHCHFLNWLGDIVDPPIKGPYSLRGSWSDPWLRYVVVPYLTIQRYFLIDLDIDLHTQTIITTSHRSFPRSGVNLTGVIHIPGPLAAVIRRRDLQRGPQHLDNKSGHLVHFIAARWAPRRSWCFR